MTCDVPGPETGSAATAGGDGAATVVTGGAGGVVVGGIVGATVVGAAVIGAIVLGAGVAATVGATVTGGAEITGTDVATDVVTGGKVTSLDVVEPRPWLRATIAMATTKPMIASTMPNTAPHPSSVSTCSSSSTGKSMIGGVRGSGAVSCRYVSWTCVGGRSGGGEGDGGGGGGAGTLATTGCSNVGADAEPVGKGGGRDSPRTR